jgi:MFS family permease
MPTDRSSRASLAGRIARAGADLRTFPRQFWLLAGGMIVLLAGIDMCFPFETTYLHVRRGVSMTTIGLMLGVPILAALPLHIVGGALADKYGRKPAIAVGVSIIVTLYFTFALSHALWSIAIALTLEAAFGWALFLTGSNAMIADLLPHKRRAEAYSITRVALDIGMVIGPLTAAVLIAADPTYRTLFLTGGAICIAFVVIVITLFRETRPVASIRHEPMLRTLAGYGVVLRDRRFLAFCAVALLPLYIFGQLWTIFPVALRQAHNMPPGSWSKLLAFYAASAAIFQYPVIRWQRNRDHVLAMAAASGLLGIGLGGAVLGPGGWPTYAFMFLAGEGVVLLIPISATVAAELAPVALRGRYMGAWTLVQMGGYALGPALGGLVIDRLGAHSAFALAGGLALIGALLYALMAGRFRRAGEDGGASADDGFAVDDALAPAPPGV